MLLGGNEMGTENRVISLKGIFQVNLLNLSFSDGETEAQGGVPGPESDS